MGMTLSWFFALVISGRDHGGALRWLAVVGAGILVLSLWIYLRDLFMPRPVILLGVAPLAAICALTILCGLLLPDWFGERLSLPKRLLVALPLVFFQLRAHLVIQGARFAPRLESLGVRSHASPNHLAQLRKRFVFWLS